MKFQHNKRDHIYTGKSKGIIFKVERNNLRHRKGMPAYYVTVNDPKICYYNSVNHEDLYFAEPEQAQNYALRIEAGKIDWRGIVKKHGEEAEIKRQQQAVKRTEDATDFIKRVHACGMHIQDFLKFWEEFSHWQGERSSEVYRLAENLQDIPEPMVHIFVEMFGSDVEKIEPYLQEKDAAHAFEKATGESYQDFVDDKIELSQKQEGTTVYYCDIRRPAEESQHKS